MLDSIFSISSFVEGHHKTAESQTQTCGLAYQNRIRGFLSYTEGVGLATPTAWVCGRSKRRSDMEEKMQNDGKQSDARRNISTKIKLDHLLNTRDLGGIRAADGAVLREKRLLRSGMLMGASAADLRRLTDEYRVRTIVDLRTAAERGESPDPVISGVRAVANTILDEGALGITFEKENAERERARIDAQLRGEDGAADARQGKADVQDSAADAPTDGTERGAAGVQADRAGHAAPKETGESSMLKTFIYCVDQLGDKALSYMAGFYPKLVSRADAIAHYRRFFELLLANEREDEALLYHCTAGKDRVGTGTILLLSALGVPRDDIVEDYLYTNECLAPRTERFERQVRAAGLPEDKVQALLEMNSVRPEYIEGIFRTIDEQYGGMDRYLREQMGLDAAAGERLRALYLR